MQNYYLNKIAMAVLVALLLFFGTRTLIDIAYEEHEPEKPGYEVAGAEGEEHGKKEKPADEGAAFIAALNKADPAKGEQDVGLCKVCHSFDKDGPTMIGPALYGVVGHKIASHEGFNYTPALRKHEDQEWTFENLNKWLTNPQAFAPGTSMAFPGIADIQKRADVVAYLNKNSDDPLPIPEPKAEEAAPEEAEEAADAGEGEAGQSEIIALLASADAGKGEQSAALCKVCHTFDAGGAAVIGPNLHNVVGHKIAAHEGFTYTPALKKHGEDAWTYENLDAWLTNPQAFAAGTSMAFPGIADAKKRADVIAFLMSMTENPPPLPEAAPAEEEAAPAEEPAAEDEPMAEEPAAEEEAAPAEEEAAPAEEPAAEEPAAEEPAAEQEPMAEEEPEAMMEEETMEETISVSPTVSEDAPSEPSAGEPASSSQPQPVYPEGSDDTMSDDTMGSEEPEAMMEEETMEETISSQPQPVYPDGEPEMDAGSDSTGSSAPSGGDALSSQPQPVYPDGKPEGL